MANGTCAGAKPDFRTLESNAFHEVKAPAKDAQGVQFSATAENEEFEQSRMQEGDISNVGTPRLDGTNTHTNGTEFYGGSSNLAFLAKLFSKARKRATALSQREVPSGAATSLTPAEESTSQLQHLNNNRSSLVDLMYSVDYHSPALHGPKPPNEGHMGTPNAPVASPSTRTANQTSPDDTANQLTNDSFAPAGPLARTPMTSSAAAASLDTELGIIEVEKIFIAAYFNNIHYIHPMLIEESFEQECQRQVWINQPTASRKDRRPQFMALYYAVVALGAINSGPDEATSLAKQYQDVAFCHGRVRKPMRSALEWASHYFDLAKQALGDIMEMSSLETCQTLFMMTVFCQNALKPHACYMYSGNAVRTAIAIGLTNNSRYTHAEEIKRTWWCIYSHEIEMCCSSGRLDSLMTAEHYSLPIPGKNVSYIETYVVLQTNLDQREAAKNPEIAIIPAMVDLARILKKASTDLYSNSGQCSMNEMSQIGLDLNKDIDQWKANLPPFLNFDLESLDDPVWAHKQKVVLKMRFYNARILVNRPFVVASAPAHDLAGFSCHVDICLDAARKTILLIHSAFVNRIYLRTWWYCATYTLYANMIILYLVLMEFPSVRAEELIADVEMSLKIYNAMKQVVVARRCAELTKEMLTVAKRHQHELQKRQEVRRDAVEATNLPPPDHDLWSDDSLSTILNQSLPGWDKTASLAQLYDPSVLEQFAFSAEGEADRPSDTWMDFSAGNSDERAITGPMWGIFEPFEEDLLNGIQPGNLA
ncbi:Fungal specific transcription factor domain-containing protein [Cladophialophora immunda]|nr:Fungal specific transcription factor domain-containing protein [Cladophialophora immunda]